MTITKKLLFTLCFVVIGLSACSNENTTSTSNTDYGLRIVASPITISAKLQSKYYPNSNDSSKWKLVPWVHGAGTLVASIAGQQEIAKATVSQNGSFTMTLPGTMTYPNVIMYESSKQNIPANLDKYVMSKAILQDFYFFPLDNPATLDTNESMICCAWVSPKVINENSLSIEQLFGYVMSENLSYRGTVRGTLSDPDIFFNCDYKKGWNIQTVKLSDKYSEISVVDSLPANVVWF